MLRQLLILAAIGLLVACGMAGGVNPSAPPDANMLPAEPPTIVGTITNVTGRRVLIEEQPGQDQGGRKIVFAVDDRTRILRRDGNALLDATAADLVANSRAEAWADGALAESYPEQGRAAVIVVSDAAAPDTTATPESALPDRAPEIVGVITRTDAGLLSN